MSKDEQIPIGLRFGKKDIILKRWHALSKDVTVGQTCYYKLALLCYIKGIPVKLGEINPYMDVCEGDVLKTLTFTKDDGELYEWISKLVGKKSSIVKKVISKSIDITSGDEKIANYAVLQKQLEGSTNIEKVIVQQINSNEPIISSFKKEVEVVNRQPEPPKKDKSLDTGANEINNFIAGGMMRGNNKIGKG